MRKKPPVATRTPSEQLLVELYGDPNTDASAARRIHGHAIPGAVYTGALRPRLAAHFGDFNLARSGMVHAGDVMARMAPRDPVEEMLVAQLLLTHSRVLHLTDIANHQTGLQQVRTIHEYADRASNTYRRLMLALAEYRRPPRTGDTFTAIKQANIAGQQVVQNQENSQPTKATNEQGFAGPVDRLPEQPGASDATCCAFPNRRPLESDAANSSARPVLKNERGRA